MVNFDRWTVLKLVEVFFAVACLITKRVTDDEASRLFLYLQKISREWSLLNNVTWDRVGAAVADATYGGYIIITGALFIGRLFEEIPTYKRISEYIFLGVGAILYVVLGSLEFASLDSVPPDLVDNAAVIGCLTLATAALFLLDIGGPRRRKPDPVTPRRELPQVTDPKSLSYPVFEVETEIEKHKNEPKVIEKPRSTDEVDIPQRQVQVTQELRKHFLDENLPTKKKTPELEEKPKRFGIYGKDAHEHDSDTDEIDDTIPPKMEQHSPVWSKIRKGQFGRYEIVTPSYLYPKNEPSLPHSPSNPSDPGYVQYTAQHWGESGVKTPRHSPV